jgi:hypothetical protein
MGTTLSLTHSAPKEDRVRANTSEEINRQIDLELEQRIRFYATQDRGVISQRIEELDREWDMERTLEANAATASLVGLLLGATVSRKWFVLPGVVAGFLLNHAVRGWCPPIPVFRRMGVRTRIEIEQERYALKILRGDFEPARKGEAGRDPKAIVKTVQC